MAEIELPQDEANALIAIEKYRADNNRYLFPGQGENLTISLHSADKRKHFLLDISRGRIDLRKGKYQNRAHQVIVLVRLDFGGAPHRNPDDEEIPCPHLHIYKEGYGHKWAIPVPTSHFTDINDRWKMFEDFIQYCNITEPPFIEKGLFI